MDAYQAKKPLTRVVLLVVLLPLLVWQCDRQEKIVGRYQADNTSAPGLVSTTLELQANGKGLWSIETDNAQFRWNLHQNTIRLHTHSGGVIEGTIDGETIQIDIPGTDTIIFRRLN